MSDFFALLIQLLDVYVIATIITTIAACFVVVLAKRDLPKFGSLFFVLNACLFAVIVLGAIHYLREGWLLQAEFLRTGLVRPDRPIGKILILASCSALGFCVIQAVRLIVDGSARKWSSAWLLWGMILLLGSLHGFSSLLVSIGAETDVKAQILGFELMAESLAAPFYAVLCCTVLLIVFGLVAVRKIESAE